MSNHPDRFIMCGDVEFDAVDRIEAAADGGESVKLKGFKMLAYSGGAMDVGWGVPVVVDLAGMAAPKKSRPILLQHDPLRIVGHTESVEIKALADRTELRVSGVISGASDSARSVVESSANGFPWQASIGASAKQVEFVDKGEKAEANGRTFKGPVYIVRASALSEVSFVALGADDNTSASVAACAALNAGESPAEPKEGKNMAEKNEVTAANGAADVAATVSEIRAAAAAESARIASVRKAAGGNAEIEAKSIAEGWTSEKTELEALRASRPTMGAPAAHIKGDEAPSDAVLTAALCKAGGMRVEKRFDAATLEAADKRFKRGIGLQELLLEAAWANGYSGRTFRGHEREVLRAGFSGFALPGILSNVANKFVLEGFNAVESSWRSIAAIRSVNDFKQISSYRLNGGFEYDEVAPNGELTHGEAGESTYTNQAKTYGKMFAVTRQDIINDDLGALTALPQRIGRGAALKLNKVFWGAFLDNSAFFTAGNNSLKTGAGTALGIDSLTQAEQAFLDQTDPDGQPLGIAPSILLVPTALNARAAALMNSTELRDTTASTKFPTVNPHAGKFTSVYSAYLSNATLTGNSSTAWYLLADPMTLATIEVAFLNGVETPTVETADADFNLLGIQMRGFHDFGVSKQEYRGGVKMAGA
jgi:phage major head subunit gpT-like protein/phage head maturation protease